MGHRVMTKDDGSFFPAGWRAIAVLQWTEMPSQFTWSASLEMTWFLRSCFTLRGGNFKFHVSPEDTIVLMLHDFRITSFNVISSTTLGSFQCFLDLSLYLASWSGRSYFYTWCEVGIDFFFFSPNGGPDVTISCMENSIISLIFPTYPSVSLSGLSLPNPIHLTWF